MIRRRSATKNSGVNTKRRRPPQSKKATAKQTRRDTRLIRSALSKEQRRESKAAECRRTPKNAKADSSSSRRKASGLARNDNMRMKAFTTEARRAQSKNQTAKTFWSSTPFARPTIRGTVTIEGRQSGVELRRSLILSAAIREADRRTPKEQGRLETVRHPADPIGYARGKAARMQSGVELRRSLTRSAGIREADRRTPKKQRKSRDGETLG